MKHPRWQHAEKGGPRRCLGYGEFEGKCEAQAGTTRTPYWCQGCDDLRCETITRQLEGIIGSLGEREVTP